MKCPFCGKHSEPAVCPFCGMEKSLADTIRHTADRFYREGYRAAAAGDYYGARQLLRRALFYDGENCRILNLLGLLLYQCGDVGEAVVMWKRSVKADGRDDNRARRYLKDFERHERNGKALLEAVRLYNEAIEQCRTGSLDYAVTRLRKAVSESRNFIKAELLLSLLLIEKRQFRKAGNLLSRIERQDPLHPMIARYRRLIAEMTEQGEEDAEKSDIRDISEEFQGSISFSDEEAQEIFGNEKKRKGTKRGRRTIGQIGMFFLGAVCCLVFVFTLLFPAQTDALRDRVRTLEAERSVMSSDQGTLQRELAGAQQAEYEAEQQKTELENELKVLKDQMASGEQQIEGNLSTAAVAFINDDYRACAEALANANTEGLSAENAALYDRLKLAIQDYVKSTVYPEGVQAYNGAQAADGEDSETLFATAAADFRIAGAFLEENTSEWFYSLYYLGRTLFFQGRYVQAAAQLKNFMDSYTVYDDLYTSAEQTYYDAQSLAKQEE